MIGIFNNGPPARRQPLRHLPSWKPPNVKEHRWFSSSCFNWKTTEASGIFSHFTRKLRELPSVQCGLWHLFLVLLNNLNNLNQPLSECEYNVNIGYPPSEPPDFPKLPCSQCSRPPVSPSFCWLPSPVQVFWISQKFQLHLHLWTTHLFVILNVHT